MARVGGADHQQARLPRRGRVRAMAFAAAVAATLAPAANVAADGFVPAGQVAAEAYITVLIDQQFPYRADVCPSGYDRPIIYGYAAENELFNQKKGNVLLGVALFSCDAGAEAPKIINPTPIASNPLLDTGMLGGWRWTSGTQFGALFSKTLYDNGSRQLVSACVEAGSASCTGPAGPTSCPFEQVRRDSAILDALEQLLRKEIGTGNVDYAWVVDYGPPKPPAGTGPTNNPDKMRLLVRTNATVACTVAEPLPAVGVRLRDQASIVFITDGTCSYRSSTGRIVYYTC